jgi:serine/threonine protein kinase
MTPERLQQIEEVFLAALEHTDQGRAAFLDEACAGDDRLRAEIELLIASDAQAGSFIESPALGAGRTRRLSAEPIIGQRIGPYEVISEIGRGGMGAVYLAARADDQYKKRVAIKVVGRDLDREHNIERFRRERQILAGLENPYVARLLDGGTTEGGLPYLVMEYIQGIPIDGYCDAQKLSITDRLKLFRKVCSAVTCAHQNMVVHRDIKPGNILVTDDGTPKLLDFGIAKLLGSETFEQSAARTATAARLMTPDYASPEQVLGAAITTASDVYSLGVLLYQLLTGCLPYRVKTRLPHEIAQAICEQEPEKPSVVISRVEERSGALTPESVGLPHEGSPEKLRRRLRGDLDNIVLKALRKEPQLRYVSVEQLSEDIRRHLEGLPVIAREGTLRYRSAKFINRHRVGMAAAAMVITSLFAGIIVSLWQAHIARRESVRAERRFNDVRRIANSFLFELNDAIEDSPSSTRAREILIKNATEYLDGLAEESANDSSLQRELAVAYQKLGELQGRPYFANLGDTAMALESYNKALAMREALLKADPSDDQVRRDLLINAFRVGEMLSRMGDGKGSLESFHRALSLSQEAAARDPANVKNDRNMVAVSHQRIGDAYMSMAEHKKALESFRRALAVRESLLIDEPANASARRDLPGNYGKIVSALAELNRTDEALKASETGVKLSQGLLKVEPHNAEYKEILCESLSRQGEVFEQAADFSAALSSYNKSLTLFEFLRRADRLNPQSRRGLIATQFKIANLLMKLRRPAEALAHQRQAVKLMEAFVEADTTNVESRIDLVDAYRRAGKLSARAGGIRGAVSLLRKAVTLNQSLLQADPKNMGLYAALLRTYRDLTITLSDAGDLRQALVIASQAASLCELILKEISDNPRYYYDVIKMRTLFGNLLLRSGRGIEGLEWYHKAIMLSEELASADPENMKAHFERASCHYESGNAYLSLASNRTTQISDSVRYLGEARLQYWRGLNILRDLHDRSLLELESVVLDDKIAVGLTKCEIMLKKYSKLL